MLLKDRVFYGAVIFFIALILIGYCIQYRNNRIWRNTFNLKEEKDSTLFVYRKDIMIDINTANKDILMSIPGIGEKLAISILNCRDSIGKFKGYKDLLLVKGIGEKKLEDIKKYVKIE